MEAKSHEEKGNKEEKVGVIPAVDLKGSDADKAYADDRPKTENGDEQPEGSDADPD